MATCLKCGANVREGKAFCSECGEPVNAPRAQASEPTPPEFGETILVPPTNAPPRATDATTSSDALRRATTEVTTSAPRAAQATARDGDAEQRGFFGKRIWIVALAVLLLIVLAFVAIAIFND